MNDDLRDLHSFRLKRASAELKDAQERRNLAILRAHEAGLSFATIARDTGLSKTRAYQIAMEKSGRALDSGTKSV